MESVQPAIRKRFDPRWLIGVAFVPVFFTGWLCLLLGAAWVYDHTLGAVLSSSSTRQHDAKVWSGCSGEIDPEACMGRARLFE